MLVQILDEGERCGLADASSQRCDVRVGFVSKDVVLVVLDRVSGRGEPRREGRSGVVNLDRVLLDVSRLVLDWHVRDEPAVVTGIAAPL